jgi:integrase
MAPQDLWIKKDGTRSARYGRGNRWRVSYEDPNTGKTRNPSFARKADAELFENNVKADISRGQYIDPKAGLVTVADYAEEWRRAQLVSPGSMDIIERAIRLHVVPVIGHMTVAGVQSGTLKHWVQDRLTKKPPLGANSIRTIYYNVIQPMFAQAVTDGLRGRTPCVGIKLPELPKGVYDLPTPDQVLDLHEALPALYRPIPLLAAGSGWRTGEILGLEKGGLELLRREAHVRHQLRELPNRPLCLAQPKSSTSARTNELATIAVEALALHLQRFPPVKTLIWDYTDEHKPVERESELVFTDEDGKPLRRPDWSRIWAGACRKAGIAAGRFTLRSLRHYFATVMIFDGANVKTVQMAMGHSTPTVTLNTYLGYWPDDARLGSRRLVDAALKRSCTGIVPAIDA